MTKPQVIPEAANDNEPLGPNECFDCGGYALADNMCFSCYDRREWGGDYD